MSVTRPSKLPRWADNGGTITEPTEGKKDIGWEAEEEPPADYANWLANLDYQWDEVVQAMSAPSVRHMLLFIPTGNGTFNWISGTGRMTVTALTGAVAEAAFPLTLAEGETLTGVTVRAIKGDTSTLAVSVALVAAGSPSSIGSASSAAAGAVAITPTVTAHTLAANEMIIVDVACRFVGDVVLDVEYTVAAQGIAP